MHAAIRGGMPQTEVQLDPPAALHFPDPRVPDVEDEKLEGQQNWTWAPPSGHSVLAHPASPLEPVYVISVASGLVTISAEPPNDRILGVKWFQCGTQLLLIQSGADVGETMWQVNFSGRPLQSQRYC